MVSVPISSIALKQLKDDDEKARQRKQSAEDRALKEITQKQFTFDILGSE